MRQTVHHPIKIVRESLADLSPQSGLRGCATVKGFARWLDHSESLIRNVENRVIELSERLAKRIERKTGVSGEWLLKPKSPRPLDLQGEPWDASKHLDPFAPGSSGAKLLQLGELRPDLLPALVSRMIEARLRIDSVRREKLEDEKPLSVPGLLRLVRYRNAEQQEHLVAAFESLLDEAARKRDGSAELLQIWQMVSKRKPGT